MRPQSDIMEDRVRLHYGHTGDIYVCGVRPECHHMGIGKALYNESVGFEPLITLTEMWDEDNPCLIMIKPLALQSLKTFS